MSPTTFAVVGSGWRSQFFLRLARAAPDRLRATGVLTRTAERGQEVEQQEGVATSRTLEELLRAERPDVVIASAPAGGCRSPSSTCWCPATPPGSRSCATA